MSKKDPYLDFLNTDSLLFGTSVGKDPLKFSDPLSFGTSDPLSFRGSDKKQDKKEDKDDFDQDSRHSGDDDFATAPPVDYLGYIQVRLNPSTQDLLNEFEDIFFEMHRYWKRNYMI